MADGIDSGASQDCITADLLDSTDTSIFADAGEQLHCSFEMHLPGLWGIDGLNAFDEEALRHSLRDFECFSNRIRHMHWRGDDAGEGLIVGR